MIYKLYIVAKDFFYLSSNIVLLYFKFNLCFFLVLPPPIAQAESYQQSASSEGRKDEIYETLGRKHRHHLRDLFVAPSFDELDLVAVDSKGEPRKLTGKQLESIRERGYVY